MFARRPDTYLAEPSAEAERRRRFGFAGVEVFPGAPIGRGTSMFSSIVFYIVLGVITATGTSCIVYLILERRIHAVPMWLVILVTFALMFVERFMLFSVYSELQLTVKTADPRLISLLKTDDLTDGLYRGVTITGVVTTAVRAVIGTCLARLLCASASRT
jgi:hypothetical protein